jgi:general secretion pathway protein A
VDHKPSARSEPPEQFTPECDFFYPNSAYEEAFATLRYGIEAKKGLMTVIGEPGTGKTTLVDKVIASFGPDVHAARVRDGHRKFSELIQWALNEFGLPSSGENRLSLMGRISDYAVRQSAAGHVVSLIIDDAQNLSDEVLEEVRLLSNLETHTDKLLQLVLVGRPEFEQRLDRPEIFYLKQRVVLRCRLRPLQEREVKSYIEARLRRLNCAGERLFNSAACTRIAFHSQGIPRRIDALCDRCLALLGKSSHGGLAADDIERVAAEYARDAC